MTGHPNAQPEAPDSPEVLCSNCGYDLRGAAVNRCSECGLEIDRTTLLQSAIPWVHRKKIGEIRAFSRTFWQLTSDSRQLRHEMARPKSLKDAQRFRIVVTLLVAMAWIIAFATYSSKEGDLAYLAVKPDQTRLNRMSGYQIDLAVPWSAGATMLLTIPICLALLAHYVTGAQRPIFRVHTRSPEYRNQVQAMSLYLCAPLYLLLPSALAWALALILEGMPAVHNTFPSFTAILRFLAIACLLLAVGFALWRTSQWTARAHYSGYVTCLLGGAELLGRWLVGIVILLGLLPWCIGFVWIVIDSLR